MTQPRPDQPANLAEAITRRLEVDDRIATRNRLEALASFYAEDPIREAELAVEDVVGIDEYARLGHHDFQANAARAWYRGTRAAHRQLAELRAQEATR